MNWKKLLAAALGVTLALLTTQLYAQSLPTPNYETPADLFDERQLIGVDRKGREDVIYSRSAALLIGNSNYRHQAAWSRLSSIPNDLTALRSVLEQHRFHVLIYYDLTGGQTQAVIEDFTRKYGYNKDTRLLVYYAGHGITRKDKDVLEGSAERSVGYIVPIDAPSNEQEQAFIQTAVRMSQFVEWATAIEVRHALFIFDSCFSGSVLGHRGRDEKRVMPPDYVFSAAARRRVREFLTSGTANQTVPAESRFAPLLVSALRGERREADINRDGYLTSSELIAFMKGWTPHYSPGQTPDSGKLFDVLLDGGEVIFKLPEERTVVRVEGSDTGGMPLVKLAPLAGSDSGTRSTSFGTAFTAEEFLTTGNHHCARECEGEPTRTGYNITLKMPADAPPGAMLSDPVLECISGSCGGWYEIVQRPKLSFDRRSAVARVDVWSRPSVWRLSAKVVSPEIVPPEPRVAQQPSASSVVLPEASAGLITAVPVVPDAPKLDAGQEEKLQSILRGLEDDNRPTRVAARQELTNLVKNSSPEVASNLIRGIPQGSYRYQIGVADALSKLPTGWTSSEPKLSREILETVKTKINDSTLKETTNRALEKLRP